MQVVQILKKNLVNDALRIHIPAAPYSELSHCNAAYILLPMSVMTQLQWKNLLCELIHA